MTLIRGDVHGASVMHYKRLGSDSAVIDCTGSELHTCGRSNVADGWMWTGQFRPGRQLLLNIGQQVNDIQQSTDKPDLLTAIATGLSEMPVVALLGARRGGKTTLTRQAVSTWSGPSEAFDLEVATDRQTLEAGPERLLRGSDGSVVFDGVQHCQSNS